MHILWSYPSAAQYGSYALWCPEHYLSLTAVLSHPGRQCHPLCRAEILAFPSLTLTNLPSPSRPTVSVVQSRDSGHCGHASAACAAAQAHIMSLDCPPSSRQDSPFSL